MIDRVKNEITNRTLNNEAVAENVKNKLNQFNQQLMDLRDALNEAVNNTANAVEANNVNQKRMEELQVIVQTHSLSWIAIDFNWNQLFTELQFHSKAHYCVFLENNK